MSKDKLSYLEAFEDQISAMVTSDQYISNGTMWSTVKYYTEEEVAEIIEETLKKAAEEAASLRWNETDPFDARTCAAAEQAILNLDRSKINVKS